MEGQRRAARLHQISVERDCRSGTANPEARRQVEGKPEPNRAGAKRSSKRIGKTQHSREPRHESPGGGSLSRGSHDKVRMLLPSRVLRVTCPAQIAKEKCGERGRNRTYNLLIKSQSLYNSHGHERTFPRNSFHVYPNKQKTLLDNPLIM